MNIKQLLVFSYAIILSSSASATTNYFVNRAPEQIQHLGNPYTPAGNPYNKTNANNPYSDFRDPYSPASVYNNYNQYATRVTNYQGKDQGTLSQSIKDPTSVDNPYQKYGNPYNNNVALDYYSKLNATNPHSDFRKVYNPISVNNSDAYLQQLYNNQGQFQGNIGSTTLNKNSVENPYQRYGNPYRPNTVFNPYPFYP